MNDFLARPKNETKKLKKLLNLKSKKKTGTKTPAKIRKQKSRLKAKIAKASRAKNRGK